MKVSVAVPCLNHVQYLGACLDSVRKQGEADFEVLIADGGSTDGSLAVARRYAGEDGRFRVASTSDNGQADAVQRCFALSNGEIFGYLNADDCYVRDDALELVMQAFAGNAGADVISFGGYYLDAEGRTRRPVWLRYHPLDTHRMMKHRTAVLQPATFWRRRVQEAIPFRTELGFAFDAWFFYEAYHTFQWLERPERIAGYRLHEANKSAGVSAERIGELVRFEAFKFGEGSFRPRYLRVVERTVRSADRLPPALAGAVKRGTYLVVNSLSFATVYRLPGI
jgi:glycosyltransferase involved in cell wall biosynthesis